MFFCNRWKSSGNVRETSKTLENVWNIIFISCSAIVGILRTKFENLSCLPMQKTSKVTFITTLYLHVYLWYTHFKIIHELDLQQCWSCKDKINYHRSYVCDLNSCENKAWKKSGLRPWPLIIPQSIAPAWAAVICWVQISSKLVLLCFQAILSQLLV